MIVGLAGFRPNREYEALSHRGKRTCRWDPGIRKQAKRRFWKQMRKQARQDARRGAGERNDDGPA